MFETYIPLLYLYIYIVYVCIYIYTHTHTYIHTSLVAQMVKNTPAMRETWV